MGRAGPAQHPLRSIEEGWVGRAGGGGGGQDPGGGQERGGQLARVEDDVAEELDHARRRDLL